MNPNNPSQNTHLLDAVCRRGVLVATSVCYWRGCKNLSPEDIDPALRFQPSIRFEGLSKLPSNP